MSKDIEKLSKLAERALGKKKAPARRGLGPSSRISAEVKEAWERYLGFGSGDHDKSTALASAVLGDPMYVKQFKMPKWNGTVSMLKNHDVAIQHAHSLGISSSKADHREKAAKLQRLYESFQHDYAEAVLMAEHKYGVRGPIISGSHQEHFPNHVKDFLRFLAHGETMIGDAVRLHTYLSKTRSPAFKA